MGNQVDEQVVQDRGYADKVGVAINQFNDGEIPDLLANRF